MTTILFLIILSALVFVHELGHFLSAKKSGIRVDEFAIGFPPTLLKKKVGETTYALNLIPFGGYVKIHGENGEDTEKTQTDAGTEAIQNAEHGGDTERLSVDDDRRFTSKSRWIQALVLVSGVLGNIIFAWLLISIGFLSGVPSSVDGRYANDVSNPKLTITSTLADTPAGKAGLASGDVILSLANGERVYRGTDADEASVFIGESQGEIQLEYIRGKVTKTSAITPIEGIVEGKPAIGVSLDTIGVVRFGIFRAMYEGVLTTWDLFREVTVGLLGFIGQAVTGQASLESVSGPVGIAGLVGEARVLGWVYLLSFTAFISINLAVINLLPIPALDGGRLLFLAIEGIIRRPIPAKFTRIVNSTGFILLLLFMAFITYRDIVKLF
ncbi:MAG: RIP metalloprotease RseP [Candidatus Taylorbacteria bacterium CG11_big_fil_rev_8_21_14_0_20_46_11]|uniref:Zinc metalloprotease n=1 Tax=Candidatus Taylorbacteria bacterium CG11_big_fil_rev_8_21_14_0_20_46_11 TaxID=1975025 RepID=A0A2H0KE72_9BACT|nr:MAG: RIP metalloprotease RseP [Candidatus Taylorbacteria bacterium CG11_big_fil_rev_8_21_14_0_20_46_11]